MLPPKKGALAALLLSAAAAWPGSVPLASAQVDDGYNYDDDPLKRDLANFTIVDIESEESPDAPLESEPELALVVTYSDETGRKNIEDHVAAKQAQGKGMKIKMTNKFKTKQKRRGKPMNDDGTPVNGQGQGGNGQAKGNSGQAKGNNGQAKGKDKRSLEVIGEIEGEAGSGEFDEGFVVLEMFDGANSTAEMTELMETEGVSNVEYDVELTVLEVTSLRGASDANAHVQQIVEAMTGEDMDGLDIEYAPEHEDEQERRRLAETKPYGIDMVNVTQLWNIDNPNGKPVKICVIDTGYDLGHPDLPSADQGTTGWHGAYGNWHIDGHSHGTHCAGTIGAIGNNDQGVVGVVPDANTNKFSFHIGKGLSDRGSGSGSNVINAVNDCVAAGARVISMSLGCSGCYSSAYDKAYQDAYDQNVMIIAAAGNSGRDNAHYPSAYRSVMSVASVRKGGGPGSSTYGELSYFSTRNSQTEIAAPGHSVLSTIPRNKGNYATKSGTSMACPHVAGVAALLMYHFPDCTNNQIRNAMIAATREPPTGDAKNTPGWDKYYGWGIVNAGLAYERLKKGCVAAGGAYNSTTVSLSDQAQGGKDQKTNACTADDHCTNGNPCLGTQKCNLETNTCYTEEGTAPNCSDNNPCTIDKCDPTKPPGEMCVHTPKQCEDGSKCNGIYTCESTTGNCVLQNDPVTCDDGSECTIDKCIPSTGECQFTSKTCNDNNPCTPEDTCDPAIGCVFKEQLENCCGNADCERDFGESEGTCAADCSDSIVTSVDPNIARYRYLGTIFNIQSKDRDIAISGTGVHCTLDPSILGKVHVYTLAGNYYANGNWYRKHRWTKVVEQDVTCAGLGQITQVTFPQEIKVLRNQVQAFSIYVLTDNIRAHYPTTRHIYHRQGRYSVYKEDSYVKIQTGSGSFCAHGWCAIITPMVYSGLFNYVVLDDPPTQSPTISFMPTKNPTVSPTGMPSESIVPTEWKPQVVELLKNPFRWANLLRAQYFEVTASTEWMTIVDMKFVTYRTTGLRVFMKRGKALDYENAPCAWQQVAVTKDGWYGHYWRRLYPEWEGGFEPVIVEPDETVSFYVLHEGNGWGFLGRRSGSRWNWYNNAWGELDPSSPVGAVKMGDGRCGERGKIFKPCNRWYGSYGMYGGLKIETMRDGLGTQAPTVSPTEPYSSETITSDIAEAGTASDHKDFFGVQFDVENIMPTDITITSLGMHLTFTDEQTVEIWARSGSHEGSDTACGPGAVKHNNRCHKWKKVANKKVIGQGLGQLTPSPSLAIKAGAGQITSIAIVVPNKSNGVRSQPTTEVAAFKEDGRLRIKHSHCIDDYYDEAVQTSKALDPSLFRWEGSITYDVVNSKCALLSRLPWTKLAYGSAEEGETVMPEQESIVYEPEEDMPDEDAPPPEEGGPDLGGGDPEEGHIME